MTRCLRSKIFTTYLFGQNYLGKMMSNILPTIKLAQKLELYKIHVFVMLLVLGNNNLMKNVNKEMIELAFASHIR